MTQTSVLARPVVAIPTYSAARSERVRELIAQLQEMHLDPWVVCNSDVTAALNWPASALRPGRNLGFGPAINAVWEASGPRSGVVAMNDDVTFIDSDLLPGSEDEIVLYVVHDDGPRYLTKELRSVFAEISLLRQLQHRAFRSAVQATKSAHPNGRLVGPFACAWIGRKAFDELGGFDPQLIFYYEDVDLLLRAHACGIRVRISQLPGARHIGSASSSSVQDAALRAQAWSAYCLLRSQGHPATVAFAVVSNGLVLRSLLAVGARRASSLVALRTVLRFVRDVASRRPPVLPYHPPTGGGKKSDGSTRQRKHLGV